MKKSYKFFLVFVVLSVQLSCSNNESKNKNNSESAHKTEDTQDINQNSKLWSNQYQKNSTISVLDKNSLSELNISDLKKRKDRLDIFLSEVVYTADGSMPGDFFVDVDTLQSHQMDHVIMGTDEITNIQTDTDAKFSTIQIEEVKEEKIIDLRWAPYHEFTKIVNILNLDVQSYYGLYDKFETELQKEVFLESKDYNTKLEKLKRLKTKMLKTTYYLDLPISYSVSNYNLDTKNFIFDRTDSYYKVAMSSNVFQFDHLLLKLPNELKITSEPYDKKVPDYSFNFDRKTGYENIPMIRHTIYLKVDDKQTAYNIETNKKNLRLFFVFNIGGIDEKDRVYGKVDHVALYNNSTGSVYQIYQ